jgi:hypothetical protein
MKSEMLIPRYTQPEILQVTKLKPEVLQTWINRNVLELADQNPGSGRRRLYSRIDVVKLALMRRVADLRIELTVARDLAGEAERMLRERHEVPWDLYVELKDNDATEQLLDVTVIASAGYGLLALKYGAIQGDARDMRVSNFTEPFENVFSRRTRIGTDDRPIDPIRRDELARAGFHAEPVVIFPFGEIVNATLLRLDDVDSRQNSRLRTSKGAG